MIRQIIAVVCIALLSSGHLAPLVAGSRPTLPRNQLGVNGVTRVNAKALGVTYPLPAGYSSWYLNDPECPGSPDSFAYYVEWWNEDESFHHDQYAGHSSYYCGSVFKGQTLDASSVYQYCVNNSPPQWNCQLLYQTWQEHP